LSTQRFASQSSGDEAIAGSERASFSTAVIVLALANLRLSGGLFDSSAAAQQIWRARYTA